MIYMIHVSLNLAYHSGTM